MFGALNIFILVGNLNKKYKIKNKENITNVQTPPPPVCTFNCFPHLDTADESPNLSES